MVEMCWRFHVVLLAHNADEPQPKRKTSRNDAKAQRTRKVFSLREKFCL